MTIFPGTHVEYRLIKVCGEFRISTRSKKDALQLLRPGCTLDGENLDSTTISTFDTHEAAAAALTRHTASVRFFDQSGLWADVEEYAIETSVYDDDGEFIDGSDYDLCAWPPLDSWEGLPEWMSEQD